MGWGGGAAWPSGRSWGYELLVQSDAVIIQPGVRLGSGWGRGFWGRHFSRGQGEMSQCPRRGGAPSWGHLHMARKDQDSGHLSAVQGGRAGGSWDARGGQTPRER